MKRLASLLLVISLSASAQPLTWSEVIPSGLPQGARLFSGVRTQPALRAWYIDIDLNVPDLAVCPYLSTTSSRKETVPDFTARTGAFAAVNGGYFGLADGASYSAVVYPDRVLAQNVAVVTRDNKSYPVTRSLFSLNTSRSPAVDWIYHFGGRPADIYRYAQPAPNVMGTPAPLPLAAAGTPYAEILTAIGGGPTLLKNGQVRISYDEEVFWGSGVGADNRDPRTAVGYTPGHHVLLMVVDGRQAASEGATLAELAAMLLELGCVEAMNLDGGGSTQMSIGATLVNRPEGQTSGVRAVPTILALVHADSLIAPHKTVYFEKIIDTADPECTLSGAGWFESANAGYYGATRSLLNTPGQGAKFAQFQPRLRGPALYEIQAWWVASSNRCQDTPFIIQHQGRSDTVRVNQTANGSAWVPIGAFSFADDGTEYIRISDAATRGQYIVADALRILSHDARTGAASNAIVTPRSPLLLHCYPNPFNNRARIRCRLKEDGHIRLALYDPLGREVAVLADELLMAGDHEWPLAAEALASGLYFVTLRDSRGGLAAAKVMLIR
ncbi:MAG TPA: phosphodiester glycosidase family protein [bacterium]|mgnify:FL=1|nr:phosphodiester glycosidase family protein [bacterium]HOY44294.1 phosphodiester glycosidase family protein [bacterium]